MKCKRCGSEIGQGDQFCGVCGWKVEPEKPRKTKILPFLILGLVLLLAAGGGVGFWFVKSQEAKEQQELEETLAQLEEEDAEEEDAEEEIASSDAEDPAEDEDIKEDQQPVSEEGIHRYEYIVSDATWNQAYADCRARGGNLVRINSREEYEYILNEIQQKGLTNIQFKLGGARDVSGREYYWVDDNGEFYGEQINTESYWCSGEWLDNEPSFQDGDTQEMYLDMFYLKDAGHWVWNDVPDDIVAAVPSYSGKLGYICEYEN